MSMRRTATGSSWRCAAWHAAARTSSRWRRLAVPVSGSVVLRRCEHRRGVATDHLVGPVAIDRLGAAVPGEDRALRVDREDGVGRRFHDRCQARRRSRSLLASRDVPHERVERPPAERHLRRVVPGLDHPVTAHRHERISSSLDDPPSPNLTAPEQLDRPIAIGQRPLKLRRRTPQVLPAFKCDRPVAL